jgi:RHS repeat-associated protein
MAARGRALAALTAVTCLLSVGLTAPAAPAAPPATKIPKPSPGSAVSGVKTSKYKFTTRRDDAKEPFRATATRWPSARTATVDLLDDSGEPAGKVKATGTPVWATATAAAPAQAELQVLDQQAAQRVGIPGVLVKVTPKDTGSGKIRIGVNYADFAEAYGGNYGSRLRWVQLPACALTTPELEACQQRTPLLSTNDVKAKAVSAEVSLTSGGGAVSKAVTDRSSVLLAATAGTASTSATGGTYAATDLKPSGSWSGGGNSGAFTYSYPIVLPPAPSGLAPSFGLSYNSSSVDGQTVATQAQASWAGDGWSTPRSFIEQSFASCANQPGGEDAPEETIDLCYDGPILLMSLNGSTSALVYDKTKKVWKAESDNGEVIAHDVDDSGSHDNGSWTVTTRDGTIYHFGLNKLPGWTSGKATTNSVDTVPVYSAHSGDPCYSDSGWEASVCDMAWRWNLDYVTDAHGNAISYHYKQNTNNYGRNLGDEDDTYVRESYLEHIDYGFRAGGAYGTVPNKIVFNTHDRCANTCQASGATASAANWPDVPFDLICDKDEDCDTWSPAFFSTARLASIVTKQYSPSAGDYVPVDTYTLTHTTPATGDGTSPTLWLSNITRTGHDTTGGGSASPITLPSVSFTGTKLANRANTKDGLPAFYRQRIDSITTETGSVIAVAYELPRPCGQVTPKANTDSCYPVYWTPDGYTEPSLDWFNKYAVTRVTQTDPTGGAPATATSYAYLGGVAWHYDDHETVKKKYRTYGQFRGYARVQTFTGDGVNDRRTKAEATFYRGMSKNNSDTVVNVTDSLGGVHEDLDDLAGRVLESSTFHGEGGAVDNSTINAYWVSAATATRSRDGLDPLTANWVATATTVARQRVISIDGTTSSWLYNQVDNSYDADIGSATVGVLKASYSHTVPAKAEYDRCTTTTYAKTNADSPLVGLISQAETVSVACGGFTQGSPASVPAKLNSLTAPTSVSRPAQVVARKRLFYDDEKWSATFPQPNAPTKGDVTMSQTADGYSNGTHTYMTTAKSSYDDYGRVDGVYDGNNNLTKTEYKMNAVGLITGTTVKAPLSHTTSTTISPLRGLTLTSTDVNNVVTTSQYDALGRGTAVWLNNRVTTAPANLKFSYTVSKTGITAATTETANHTNGYIKSVTLYDALMRVRQTQSVTAAGGRLVADNFYDTRGWVLYTYNGWWDPATTPTVGSPVTAADLKGKVPSQTFNTYDGLGRAVVVEQAKNNTTVSKTTAVYQGNRTTVFPPDGDTVKSKLADPIGRTTSLTEYKVRPRVVAPSDTFTGVYGVNVPVPTAGTVSTTTTYGYDQRGNQHKVTDTKSNVWASTFNLLGQVTAKTDPDAGDTKDMTYDGNGNLLQATDSRGETVSTTYDQLNRATATYAAPTSAQAATNQLTARVYDNSNNAVANMTYPKGHLTTATAYSGGQAYKTQARGFTVFGGATAETTTIPASEGALAGDYTVAHTYTTNSGLPLKDIYPAKANLPSESVLYSYDGFDTLESVGGTVGYLQSVNQDAYGRINQLVMGSDTSQAHVSNTWDEHTGLLKQRLVTRKPTTPSNVDQQNYEYDLAGNLIKQISQRLAAGTGETQCYDYDELRRLTKAWTATDDCATTPTTDAHAMVGNTIGSGSAYWTSWDFDDLGNRTSEIRHAITGSTDTTTDYAYATNGQAHTLTSTDTTGAVSGSTSYTYDVAGYTKTRTIGTGAQTLDWDATGKLASITTPTGTTRNIYGPDGGLLLEKTPGSTTLYLGSQQFVLNTSTNTIAGTRYYALPGGSAIRTGNGANYSFTLSDRHGTPLLYLDSTAQTPTWRQQTVYGENRGVDINIPDNRTFLNKTLNKSTGLIQMGARQYDATIGRFISVDPLQIMDDPQQWNGYAYSYNNPVVYSDPTGLAGDTGNGSGNGVRFNPGTGDVTDGGTGNVYDGTDESDGYVDKDSGNGKGKGGGTGGTVKVADVVDVPVVIPDGLKDALKDWDYGSDVYTMASLSAFAAQGDQYWQLICSWLAKDVWATCGGSGAGVSNPFVEGNEAKGWIAGGLVVVVVVGSLVCAEAYFICLGVAAEAVAGEAAFAATGSMVGATGFGFWGASKLAGAACSFSQDTEVLMADGSAKRFEDLRTGDMVLATDPETGEQAPKKIEKVWVHDDDLYVLTVDGQRLVTTEDHPFWNETDQAWNGAQDLDPGDLLRTPTGTARVDEFDEAKHRKALAYNLTVAELHTYYVLAGGTPVLVHNTGCDHIALGLQEANGNRGALDEFGMEMGALTYSEWPGNGPWYKKLQGYLGRGSTTRVSVNLDGIDDPIASARAGANVDPSGYEGLTNWELHQISQSPDAWSRITFYQGGSVVPNPFG